MNNVIFYRQNVLKSLYFVFELLSKTCRRNCWELHRKHNVTLSCFQLQLKNKKINACSLYVDGELVKCDKLLTSFQFPNHLSEFSGCSSWLLLIWETCCRDKISHSWNSVCFHADKEFVWIWKQVSVCDRFAPVSFLTGLEQERQRGQQLLWLQPDRRSGPEGCRGKHLQSHEGQHQQRPRAGENPLQKRCPAHFKSLLWFKLFF